MEYPFFAWTKAILWLGSVEWHLCPHVKPCIRLWAIPGLPLGHVLSISDSPGLSFGTRTAVLCEVLYLLSYSEAQPLCSPY